MATFPSVSSGNPKDSKTRILSDINLEELDGAVAYIKRLHLDICTLHRKGLLQSQSASLMVQVEFEVDFLFIKIITMTNVYEGYIIEAERLFEDDMIDEAEKLLIDILHDEPDFAKAHNHLGWLYLYKKEDLVKAEMHLNYAIKFDSNYVPPYLHLASLFSKKDDVLEAERMYKIGVSMKDAEKSTFYEQLAMLYETKGRYSDAIKSYEKAILQSNSSWFVDNCKDAIQRIRKKRRIKFWSRFF